MMQAHDAAIQKACNEGEVQPKLARRIFQLVSRLARPFLLTGLPRGVADRIRLEQVNVLSILVGVMAVMGQGTVLLVAHEFWQTPARMELAPVEATIFVAYAALVVLGLRWNGIWRVPMVRTADQVRSRYVQIIAVLGLAWGILFVALMPLTHENTRSLMYGLIVGLISAGALVVPLSAALAFWVPIMAASFIATAMTPVGSDFAGFVMLAGYGVLTLFSMLYLNLTLIRRALGEIEQQEGRETIGLLLRDFEDAACDWLWETDEGGLLTHVSDRFARITQREPSSLFGMTFTEILGLPPSSPVTNSGQPGMGVSALSELMERRLPFRDFEVCLQVGAEVVWWSLTGKPKFAAPQVFEGYRGVGSDVTYVKRVNDRARYLAQYDELTGLANRRLFRETLDTLFQTSGASSIALLCLDLDRFKAVNDTRGHPIGDMLLVAVARRLESQVRTGDLCARLGGDEFAIVLAVTDAALARVIAARLVVELSQPYVIDGSPIEIGVSIGIAMGVPGTASYDALLKDADAALYRAKAEGRGVACFHTVFSGEPGLRKGSALIGWAPPDGICVPKWGC